MFGQVFAVYIKGWRDSQMSVLQNSQCTQSVELISVARFSIDIEIMQGWIVALFIFIFIKG